MTPIKTILCATDFSDCSTAALGAAVDLAKRMGARIRLVHVFQLPSYVGWEEGMATAAMSGEFLQELRAQSDKQLQRQLAECRKTGVEVEAELVDGAPYLQLVERSAKADLVVIGTHGRTGLPRLMLGSVAERVVRLAKCPVLTVPLPAAS
jgi:nucleotide-binding universal stress UspA family protein